MLTQFLQQAPLPACQNDIILSNHNTFKSICDKSIADAFRIAYFYTAITEKRASIHTRFRMTDLHYRPKTMKKKLLLLLLSVGLSGFCASGRNLHSASLLSPDRSIEIKLTFGPRISYEVQVDGFCVVAPTPVGMTLEEGTEWGKRMLPARIRTGETNSSFETPFYIRNRVEEHYNWLRADFREGFSLEVRTYDDGVAYRFVSNLDKPLIIRAEEAGARFPADWNCRVPYVRDSDGREIIPFGRQFKSSFENLYTSGPLSQMDPARLAFLPLVVTTDRHVNLCFTEADLESYPGMYLLHTEGQTALRGVFAPYPKRTHDGGYDNLQNIVDEYEPFLAKAAPRARFPWRTILIARQDRDLLNNDMVMRLASPCRIADTSWIHPGKAAWEWWNDWGLYGVDFTAGINTPTYKYYIDFAARNGIEYLVMDDGWSKDKTDLMKGGNDQLDLEEILRYAARKRVGIILWAGFRAFERNMEEVCRHYAEMGVKGFKVDFMDRDDQQIVEFLYRAAETAAKYGLMLDFHGIFKPTGLQRTYPNVVNFEGVHGLEQMKWSEESVDQVTYDVTMPFIRMVAGPVDYTPGAMLNAAHGLFTPQRSRPMSQGTRCRQLAEYILFHAPLAMLCDSPSNYDREPECRDFICRIPTVWDQTVALDGRIGEFAVTARRSGDTWYVGGLTGHSPRTLTLDLGFLDPGASYTVEIFCDGANAAKYGQDYRHEIRPLGEDRMLEIPMAPAGGFALRIFRN